MFTAAKPVKECPWTRQSNGVVYMSPELIAQLSAAVSDADEWAIVLTGERREDGYVAEVTGYFLPPQERSSGHVDVGQEDYTMRMNYAGTPEDPNVVGVIHSHHTMGAFFSTTDATKLNPCFPISIVLASKKLTYLGFDYKGTGKVTLPCGATGEVDFFIQPTLGPEVATVKQVTHKESDLGDCNNYSNEATDAYHYQAVAKCGLSEPEGLKADAFGSSKELLDVVVALPRPAVGYQSLIQIREDNFSYCPAHKCNDNCTWCNSHQVFDACSTPSGKQNYSGLSNKQKRQSKHSARKPESGGKWYDRFLRSNNGSVCPGCDYHEDFCICEDDDTETPDDTETEYGPSYEKAHCDTCGNFVLFDNDWNCPICGEISEYCIDCDRGHDVRIGCPEEVVLLGN